MSAIPQSRQTVVNAFYLDPALLRPSYRRESPYSVQVMSAMLQSRQAMLTALCRDPAFFRPPYRGKPPLFIPGYECNSPVAPSGVDRLLSGHRLTQTALLEDPYSVRRIFNYAPEYPLVKIVLLVPAESGGESLTCILITAVGHYIPSLY